MNALRNEVEASDLTDHSAEAPMTLTIVVLGTLHALCCGLPLLLLSGFSLNTLLPASPVTGLILAALGVAGIAWSFKARCSTRSDNSLFCRSAKGAAP